MIDQPMARAYSFTEQALADAVARLDTIRNQTIEECARVAENWNGVHYGRQRELDIAAAIRALKDEPHG